MTPSPPRLRTAAARADAPCGRRFDEALLSGWVDGMLTQQERQQVQLHLDTCALCRRELADLVALRDAARHTPFLVPADEQWSELPKTTGSRVLRLSGWALLATWLAVMTTVAVVLLLRSGAPAWERLLVIGGAGGFALLLLSALLDRLQQLGTDRYRRVQK
jgi:anti-sigma factor RsiW